MVPDVGGPSLDIDTLPLQGLDVQGLSTQLEEFDLDFFATFDDSDLGVQALGLSFRNLPENLSLDAWLDYVLGSNL